MCDQTEIEYKAGEVVWCKLSNMWWPALVQDQKDLEKEVTQGLRRKPFAVVKFFNEDLYDFVKDINHICHYNSSRKLEFIKKGMDAFRTRGKTNQMSKFPKDIVMAEELTGGNSNILNDPRVAPEEKVSYKELFTTPKPLKESKNSKKSKNSSSKDRSLSGSFQFFGKSGSEKKYFKKYLNHQEPLEPATVQYKCPDCSFVCSRLMILCHHKAFNKQNGCPKALSKFSKSNSSVKLEKGSVKRKSVGNETTPAKKKLKTLVKGPVDETAKKVTKVKTTVSKEVKEKDKKKSEAMREQLLLDWDEVDAEEMKQVDLDDSDVAVVKPEEKPNANVTSCFDFDDNEEDMNMDRSVRFGQKLPRVIPKEDKIKDHKTKEKNLHQDDGLEEEFNNLMKETVVPIMTDSFLLDSSVLPGTSGKAEANLGFKTNKDKLKSRIGDVTVEERLPSSVEVDSSKRLDDDNTSLLRALESDSPAELEHREDSNGPVKRSNSSLCEENVKKLKSDADLLASLRSDSDSNSGPIDNRKVSKKKIPSIISVVRSSGNVQKPERSAGESSEKVKSQMKVSSPVNKGDASKRGSLSRRRSSSARQHRKPDLTGETENRSRAPELKTRRSFVGLNKGEKTGKPEDMKPSDKKLLKKQDRYYKKSLSPLKSRLLKTESRPDLVTSSAGKPIIKSRKSVTGLSEKYETKNIKKKRLSEKSRSRQRSSLKKSNFLELDLHSDETSNSLTDESVEKKIAMLLSDSVSSESMDSSERTDRCKDKKVFKIKRSKLDKRKKVSGKESFEGNRSFKDRYNFSSKVQFGDVTVDGKKDKKVSLQDSTVKNKQVSASKGLAKLIGNSLTVADSLTVKNSGSKNAQRDLKKCQKKQGRIVSTSGKTDTKVSSKVRDETCDTSGMSPSLNVATLKNYDKSEISNERNLKGGKNTPTSPIKNLVKDKPDVKVSKVETQNKDVSRSVGSVPFTKKEVSPKSSKNSDSTQNKKKRHFFDPFDELFKPDIITVKKPPSKAVSDSPTCNSPVYKCKDDASSSPKLLSPSRTPTRSSKDDKPPKSLQKQDKPSSESLKNTQIESSQKLTETCLKSPSKSVAENSQVSNEDPSLKQSSDPLSKSTSRNEKCHKGEKKHDSKSEKSKEPSKTKSSSASDKKNDEKKGDSFEVKNPKRSSNSEKRKDSKDIRSKETDKVLSSKERVSSPAREMSTKEETTDTEVVNTCNSESQVGLSGQNEVVVKSLENEEKQDEIVTKCDSFLSKAEEGSNSEMKTSEVLSGDNASENRREDQENFSSATDSSIVNSEKLKDPIEDIIVAEGHRATPGNTVAPDVSGSEKENINRFDHLEIDTKTTLVEDNSSIQNNIPDSDQMLTDLHLTNTVSSTDTTCLKNSTDSSKDEISMPGEGIKLDEGELRSEPCNNGSDSKVLPDEQFETPGISLELEDISETGSYEGGSFDQEESRLTVDKDFDGAPAKPEYEEGTNNDVASLAGNSLASEEESKSFKIEDVETRSLDSSCSLTTGNLVSGNLVGEKFPADIPLLSEKTGDGVLASQQLVFGVSCPPLDLKDPKEPDVDSNLNLKTICKVEDNNFSKIEILETNKSSEQLSDVAVSRDESSTISSVTQSSFRSEDETVAKIESVITGSDPCSDSRFDTSVGQNEQTLDDQSHDKMDESVQIDDCLEITEVSTMPNSDESGFCDSVEIKNDVFPQLDCSASVPLLCLDPNAVSSRTETSVFSGVDIKCYDSEKKSNYDQVERTENVQTAQTDNQFEFRDVINVEPVQPSCPDSVEGDLPLKPDEAIVVSKPESDIQSEKDNSCTDNVSDIMQKIIALADAESVSTVSKTSLTEEKNTSDNDEQTASDSAELCESNKQENESEHADVDFNFDNKYGVVSEVVITTESEDKTENDFDSVKIQNSQECSSEVVITTEPDCKVEGFIDDEGSLCSFQDQVATTSGSEIVITESDDRTRDSVEDESNIYNFDDQIVTLNATAQTTFKVKAKSKSSPFGDLKINLTKSANIAVDLPKDFPAKVMSADFLTPDKIKEIFNRGEQNTSPQTCSSLMRPIVVPPQSLLDDKLNHNTVASASSLPRSLTAQDVRNMELDINSMPVVIADSPEIVSVASACVTTSVNKGSNIGSTITLQTAPAPSQPVQHAAVSPVGRTNLSLDIDHYVKLVRPGTFKPKPEFKCLLFDIPPARPPAPVPQSAFHTTSKLVRFFSQNKSNVAKISQDASGSKELVIVTSAGKKRVIFKPDSNFLSTLSNNVSKRSLVVTVQNSEPSTSGKSKTSSATNVSSRTVQLVAPNILKATCSKTIAVQPQLKVVPQSQVVTYKKKIVNLRKMPAPPEEPKHGRFQEQEPVKTPRIPHILSNRKQSVLKSVVNKVSPASNKIPSEEPKDSCGKKMVSTSLLKISEADVNEASRLIVTTKASLDSLESNSETRKTVRVTPKEDILAKALANTQVFQETVVSEQAATFIRQPLYQAVPSNVSCVTLGGGTTDIPTTVLSYNLGLTGIVQPSMPLLSDEASLGQSLTLQSSRSDVPLYQFDGSQFIVTTTPAPKAESSDNLSGVSLNRLLDGTLVTDGEERRRLIPSTRLTADINLAEIELPPGRPPDSDSSPTSLPSVYNDISSIPLPPEPYTGLPSQSPPKQTVFHSPSPENISNSPDKHSLTSLSQSVGNS